MLIMPGGVLTLLENNHFQAAAFNSYHLIVIIIFTKVDAQKLSSWQHIVNDLMYFMQ